MKEKRCRIIIATTIVILFILMLVIDRIHYLLMATANVPVMDYWGYIVQFVEKMYNGGVTLADVWAPQITSKSHRGGISTMFFLLNTRFFGLNTQIEIILGAIASAVNAIFLYAAYVKRTQIRSVWAKCAFVLIGFCIFNINQWEIITLEFSLGFSVRILLILWSLYCLDVMQERKFKGVYVAGFSVMLLLVACLTGSYAPAVLGTFVFVFLVQLLLEKERRIRIGLQNFTFILMLSIGIVIFYWGLEGNGGGGMLESLVMMVKDGSLFKGVFLMLGSSVLHIESPLVQQHGNALLYLGMGVFMLYLYAIFLFFYRKMYEKTYYPIMLMAYTACIILVITYGRIPVRGVNYVVSSRYVCETTLGLAGMFWIYLYEIQYRVQMKGTNIIRKMWAVSTKAACFIGIFIILFGLGYSRKTEMLIAPGRKVYYESMIDLAINNETLTDEQAQRFQAPTHIVNQGLEIMREYQLGVFRN